MSIVYHGDHYGTTKIDPRWMLHQQSINSYGIGIYFASTFEESLTYGPKVCSINTKGLNLFEWTSSLKTIEGKLEKFIRYLHKTRPRSKYSIRKKDRWLIGKRNFILSNNERKLYEIFSQKSFDEDLYDKINFSPVYITRLQTLLAIFYGYENIIEFVHGWNKIIQIDGIEDSMRKYVSIIQTKVKVTPVNF